MLLGFGAPLPTNWFSEVSKKSKRNGGNTPMKTFRWVGTLVVLMLLAFAVQSRSSGPPFSNGTLSGTYIFGSVTAHPSGGASDTTGIATFDGAGNISGTLQGFHEDFTGTTTTACPVSFTGTYAVAADGSLTASLTLASPCDGEGNTFFTFVGETVHNGHEFILVGNGTPPGRATMLHGVEQ
jgi:hypothetical protein